MFNINDIVKRTAVAAPTDGSEPTNEGVGYVGIVQVLPLDNNDGNYVWVKFPELISLGPFGPMKGVTTRVIMSDINKITQEQWNEGLEEDRRKPKKFMFKGKEYELDEYECLKESFSSQKAQ